MHYNFRETVRLKCEFMQEKEIGDDRQIEGQIFCVYMCVWALQFTFWKEYM